MNIPKSSDEYTVDRYPYFQTLPMFLKN